MNTAVIHAALYLAVICTNNTAYAVGLGFLRHFIERLVEYIAIILTLGNTRRSGIIADYSAAIRCAEVYSSSIVTFVYLSAGMVVTNDTADI